MQIAPSLLVSGVLQHHRLAFRHVDEFEREIKRVEEAKEIDDKDVYSLKEEPEYRRHFRFNYNLTSEPEA